MHPQPRRALTIKVVSYNIHKCIGGIDRKYAPERIRDVLQVHDPDFVFLQEVDEGAPRSAYHRQVDLLGDMLKLHHRVFFPNVRLLNGGHYGNAILSRHPLREAHNIDLSLPFSKRRSVLYARARVRSNGGRGYPRTLHLYNLHLGLSQRLRERQLQKFIGSHPFAHCHLKTPIVLAGDFNDVWGTLWQEYLPEFGFRGTARPKWTFPAWGPIRALDGVYVRGDAELLDVRSYQAPPARWASDHLPLVAEIRIQ